MIGFRDFVIIILLLGLTGRLFADAKFDEGNRLGVEAAYNILKDINTPEKINNRFSKPLTNNDSLLETFDKDPKRIDVQLTNESSDQFLEITIQPILLTGELDINIKADFNLKGRFTQVLAIPFSVSGVCAQNGFISCSPGTWEDCRHYEWFLDGEMTLGFRAIGFEALSSCYCVNNSCGGVSSNDLKRILETFGGSIIGAVQAINPKLTITRVETEDNVIRYYGQDTKNAAESKDIYFSGVANPEELYGKKDEEIREAAENERLKQEMEPDSYYSDVFAAFKDSGQNASNESCVIKRRVQMFPIPRVITTNTCDVIDETICQLKTERICDYEGDNCIYTVNGFNPTREMPSPSCKNMGLYNWCADGNSISDKTLGVLKEGDDIWYHIEREYVCHIEPEYDTDETLGKADDIYASVKITDENIEYKFDDSLETIKRPDLKDPEVEKMCKIRRIVEGTDVTQKGRVSDYRDNFLDKDEKPVKYNESYEYSFVLCDPETNECIVGEDEVEGIDYEVLERCTNKSNSFGDVLSVLMSIKKGSQDMVCSKK